MSLLEIKNLHASVDGHEILKGINLTINPGEVHSIMGPNGSGKSTLAQVLARRQAYDVTAGSINFLGKDLLEIEGLLRLPDCSLRHGRRCRGQCRHSHREYSNPKPIDVHIRQTHDDS